jgi:alkanesulfonate monooxygenase SsuD/methylene tetrahydromethanopterin reductase-like flavin-dependent oxidoreductase (luciferase family)
MAIQIGVFHNGASDLPLKKTKGGIFITDGTLAQTHESAQRVLVNQVRQGILAESLGFDAFYMTEHHFQPEGAEFSPNPLLAETAIAARTKRIRLFQMANIVPWHHPIRLAEEAAMLDVISGGRLEFGIGRGYQPREAEVFGWPYGSTAQDQERNRSYFDEAVNVIIKSWTEDSFSYHGEFLSIPPSYTKWNHQGTIEFFSQPGVGRELEDVLKIGGPAPDFSPVLATTTTLREISVYPHPLQKPHPQIWQPLVSERSLRGAAQRGINPFFDTDTNKKLKQDVEVYYDEAQKHGWPDRLGRGEFKYGYDAEKNRGVGLARWVHIVDEGIGNMDRAAAGLEQQWDYYGPFGFAAAINDPDEDPYPLDMRVTMELLREKGFALFGSKEFIIDSLLSTKAYAGLEDFNIGLFFELGGFAAEEIEEQMQSFAEDIMPALRKECGGAPNLPESAVNLEAPLASVTGEG